MKKFREKVSTISQLQPNLSRDVQNTFRAYETSWETECLESEKRRKVYCELIDLGRQENSENISENFEENSIGKTTKLVVDKLTIDDNDSDEDEQVTTTVSDDKAKWWTRFNAGSNQPRRLRQVAAQTLAESYKKGPVDERIWCQDAIDFGLNADIELPILDLLEIKVKLVLLVLKFNFHQTKINCRMKSSGNDLFKQKSTMPSSFKNCQEFEPQTGSKLVSS